MLRKACSTLRQSLSSREDTLRSCAGSIRIVNEGTTDLEDVVIRCQMIPGVVPLPPIFPDTYPYSETIGTLEDEIIVYVDGMFADTGVDIAGLNRLLDSELESDEEHLRLRDEKDAEIAMTFEEYDQAVKGLPGTLSGKDRHRRRRDRVPCSRYRRRASEAHGSVPHASPHFQRESKRRS